MKHIFCIMCSLFLLLQAGSSFAVDRTIKRNTDDGERRIALVIGNGGYTTGKLKNPVNDALDVAALLKGLGFEVIVKTDVDKRGMKTAIDAFARRLQQSDVGLFYYAGHGMQVQGANFLIPVGAAVHSESDIEFEAVHAGRVLGKMREADSSLNIVILDACRNNPFKRSFRSGSSGLAKMDAPRGTIIAYATSPGSVAADGDGRNGLYTRALLNNFKIPGLTVQEAFNSAGMEVMEESNRRQVPWMSSTPVPAFYLAAAGIMTVDRSESVPQATPSTGSLVVKTEPSGAKVWVDEGYEGCSPVAIDSILPGLVSVRAGKNGFEDAVEKVRIRSGRRSELTLLLGKEAEPAGRLFVEPTPPDALVRVLNIVPRYQEGMELTAGSYTVEVSSRGYMTETRKVELAAGEDLQVAVVLEKQKPKGPKAGDTWTESSTGMEFVFVPGGCFQMGDAFGVRDDEKPVHEVCLDSFWIGKYEVTQGQWTKIMGSNPAKFKKGNDYPVEQVSWNDAVEFAGRLSSRGGKTFRLPTEAQWEYAARSGGKPEMYSGSNSPDYVAWHADNSNNTTHRIGLKKSNGLGIHDMSGNVWEMCSDWYGKNYYSSSPSTNPPGPSSGSLLVDRGGGWSSSLVNARSAARLRGTPDGRYDFVGLRLAFFEGSSAGQRQNLSL